MVLCSAESVSRITCERWIFFCSKWDEDLLIFLVRWDWVSWYCGHYWPIVPAPDDRWWWLWRNWWNEDWQGNPKYPEKTCPSATLSTTNLTWLDPGSNPGRRDGKPATNRLSYGAAYEDLCSMRDRKAHFDHFSIFSLIFTSFVFGHLKSLISDNTGYTEQTTGC
jgi:hypothetical protein